MKPEVQSTASDYETEAVRRVVRFLLNYYRAMPKQRMGKDKEMCA
jgi:hypothetical protein